MKNLRTFFIVIFLLSLSSNLFSSEALTTNSFKTVFKKVKELNRNYGSSKVLVVFDIDNTVLAMTQSLGSDQWFTWQAGLLFGNSDNAYKITDDFEKLLRIQKALYYRTSMRKPEGKITSKVIKRIQKMGNTTFALTARGHETSYVTVRELLKNDLNFSKTGPKYVSSFYLAQKAFNPKTVVEKYGFDITKSKALKLSNPSTVQYLDGVFYTAGAHKGVILKIFIKETGILPKAIVFVDDKAKHTNRVQDAFTNTDIEVITYRYSREDDFVDKFNSSDKKIVHYQLSTMGLDF